MKEKKSWWRSLSIFEKISTILIPILIVAILITAIIIADKNDKINDLKDKNDEITGNYIICQHTQNSQNFSLEDIFLRDF